MTKTGRSRTHDLFAPPPAGHGGGGRIRAGVGGWTYAPWRDDFYPAGLVQRRELEYASRRLSAIEINGTYYGTQKPETYARWRDETPEDFVFTAKAPRRIVESRKLAATAHQVQDFVGGIAELGPKLGALLWQLPAGRRPDAEDFAAFLQALPREANGRRLRHALEIRDPAFVGADLVSLARRHGMALVYTDSAEHPSFADLAADFVYARLMRSRTDVATGYPPPELREWARRAREWASGGDPDELPHATPAGALPPTPRDVFVFFIASAKERNPAAAMALLGELGLAPA